MANIAMENPENQQGVNHTPQIITPHLKDAEAFKTMNARAISECLEKYKGKPTYHDLLKKATEIVQFRASHATDEQLELMLGFKELPDWIHSVVIVEQGNRVSKKNKAIEAGKIDKEAKLFDKPRRKTPFRGKFLPGNMYDSIFKVKVQYADTRIVSGIELHFIDTYYSNDYPEERSWFDEKNHPDKYEVMMNHISQSGPHLEQLFDEGSVIRKKGFNGYTFNMIRFKQLIDQKKLRWCGIFLNKLTEQQANGEAWDMHIWSLGEYAAHPIINS